MTHTTQQSQQSNDRQQEQAPSVQGPQGMGPDNRVLGGALGLVGAVVPDIAADNWIDAVRKMGPLGTVVLDAQPDAMLEQGLPHLIGEPFVREWVADRLAGPELPPAVLHWLVDRVCPVGCGIGVAGELGVAVGADLAPRADGSLTRTGPDAWTASMSVGADVALGVGVGASVKGAFGDALVEAAFGGGPALSLEITSHQELGLELSDLTRELAPHGLVSGQRGGGFGAALFEVCAAALRGTAPDSAVGEVVAGAKAAFAAPDLEAALPDFLSPQGLDVLPDGLFMSLVSSLSTQAGLGLEWAKGELEVVARLGSEGGLDLDRGLLSLVPGVGEFLAELDGGFEAGGGLRLSVGLDGLSFRALRVNTLEGDVLHFDALAAARSFFGRSVGPSATAGEALRSSGLVGLTHTVSLDMADDEVDFPDALDLLEDLAPDRNLVAAREETQVQLTARVDAQRLALVLDDVLFPSTMDPATAAMTAMRAALDMTRGVLPPGWITRKVDQAAFRSCVGFDAPRLVGKIRFGVGAGGRICSGELSGAAEAYMSVDQELPRQEAGRIWPVLST